MKSFSLPLLCSGFLLLVLSSSASSSEDYALFQANFVESEPIKNEQRKTEKLSHAVAHLQEHQGSLFLMSMLLGGGLGVLSRPVTKPQKAVSAERKADKLASISKHQLEHRLAQAGLNLFLESNDHLTSSRMSETIAPEYAELMA